MKTHGDPGWKDFPSYFDIFIPQLLDTLDQFNLKITFFLVGQDVALERNTAHMKSLTERGHEVGNHSFSHEPWLQKLSAKRIEREVLETENRIVQVTGQKPLGFRGPGFSWNRNLMETLIKYDYKYDTSILPTYFGALARMYYFRKSELTEEEKNQRKHLFGTFKNGSRPVKPFLWHLPSGNRFLEIPVTTIPFIKIPFHLSYLLYLSRFSKKLMLFYLNVAIKFCKITRTNPSFLLHPLDFLGSNQVPELRFFPGMDLGREYKMEIFQRVIRTLSEHFELVTMSTLANNILENKKLKIIKS